MKYRNSCIQLKNYTGKSGPFLEFALVEANVEATKTIAFASFDGFFKVEMSHTLKNEIRNPDSLRLAVKIIYYSIEF